MPSCPDLDAPMTLNTIEEGNENEWKNSPYTRFIDEKKIQFNSIHHYPSKEN